MELEPAPDGFEFTVDRRPRMDEPVPVRLVAVADVCLLTPPDKHEALHQFYVTHLQFAPHPQERLVFQASNHSIRFQEQDIPVAYLDLKPLMIEVRSLPETEQKLYAAEIDYTRQKHVVYRHESLLLRDPGGNWIELVEHRQIL